MGLFSSKTKTYVSSVNYNMAGDADDRPNILRQHMTFINSARQHVSEELPRKLIHGMGVKLNRAYKHAKTVPGAVPTSSIQMWDMMDLQDEVQRLMDENHGVGKYIVDDAYITETNTAPLIEEYLNKQYGWDSVTGKMSSPPVGVPKDGNVQWTFFPPQKMLGDISPKISRAYALEFREHESDPFPVLTLPIFLKSAYNQDDTTLVAMMYKKLKIVQYTGSETRAYTLGDVTGTVVSTETSGEGSLEVVTITTIKTVTDGINTTIETKVENESYSETFSQSFVLGTGMWPTLDDIYNSSAFVEQTFFPSIPFRVDNKDVVDDKLAATASYKHTDKLCALLGLNMLDIRDGINSNKDIKEIDYAFLVLGANMNTQSQAEMEYLFRFWDMCKTRERSDESAFGTWKGIPLPNRNKPSTNQLVISDSKTKNGAYKITIEWNYIKKVTVTGLAFPDAKPGKYTIINGATSVYEMGAVDSRYSVDATVVSIRKQINETQYEELQISGAVHKNDVYEGKTVETLARNARSDPEENEGFLIPLHMGIYREMSLISRNQLAQECVNMVFNCYQKVKKKWYQKGIFKVILAIVLIVITAMSWGTATPITSSVWGAVALAGAVTGLSVAMAGLILATVYGYVASYILGKWSAGFASVFGNKLGAIIQSVVAIVVSVYAGGGNLSSMFQSAGNWLQSAVRLVGMVSQLFMAYVKGTMMDLDSAHQAWMEQAEADQKKVDALAEDFFGKQDLVSIDYLLQLQKTLREDSPSVFLTRTLMVGSDIVEMTLGQISEMVALQTQSRLAGITA